MGTATEKMTAWDKCFAKTTGTTAAPVYDACMCQASKDSSKANADALAACTDETIINKTRKDHLLAAKIVTDTWELALCKKVSLKEALAESQLAVPAGELGEPLASQPVAV